jgi:hypothetical protein
MVAEADDTDIRPTMMALLGLHDDHVSDGRVLLEDVSRSPPPSTAWSLATTPSTATTCRVGPTRRMP